MSSKLLSEQLTLAVLSGDLQEVKTLISSSQNWCRIRSSYGRTILQEAILRHKKEIFDYMLQHQNMADLEIQNASGETALEFTLSRSLSNHELQEYFALELIKKGAYIHGGNVLHLCVKHKLTKVCEDLLKRGLDVNQKDPQGHTALQELITHGTYEEADDEILGMLLYYGAFPTFVPTRVLSKGITYSVSTSLFDVAVMQEYPMDLCETIFFYSFDNLTALKVSLKTLQLLAQTNPAFFLWMNQFNINCIVQAHNSLYVYDSRIRLFDNFWRIDLEILQVFFKKYNTVYYESENGEPTKMTLENYLMEILLNATIREPIRPDTIVVVEHWTSGTESPLKQFQPLYPYYFFIDSDHFFTHLQFFVEFSPKMKEFVEEFLAGLVPTNVLYDVTNKYKDCRSKGSELVMYMMQHGLPYNRICADVVYTYWGFCELFKWFLYAGECEKPKIPIPVAYPDVVWYIDGVAQTPNYPEEQEWTIHPDTTNDLPINIVVYLCFNVRTHLEDIFENPSRYVKLLGTEQLLDYFADPKLGSFLLKCHEKRPLKEEVLTRIAKRQCFPLLVEMARNVLRKYLVEKFNVQNNGEFYDVLRRLPISYIHKDIITFGHPLYKD